MLYARSAAMTNATLPAPARTPLALPRLATAVVLCFLCAGSGSCSHVKRSPARVTCAAFVHNSSFVFVEYEVTLYTTASSVRYDWKGDTYGNGGAMFNVAPGIFTLRLVRDVLNGECIALDMVTTSTRNAGAGLYRLSPGSKPSAPNVSYHNHIHNDVAVDVSHTTDLLTVQSDGGFEATLWLQIE